MPRPELLSLLGSALTYIAYTAQSMPIMLSVNIYPPEVCEEITFQRLLGARPAGTEEGRRRLLIYRFSMNTRESFPARQTLPALIRPRGQPEKTAANACLPRE